MKFSAMANGNRSHQVPRPRRRQRQRGNRENPVNPSACFSTSKMMENDATANPTPQPDTTLQHSLESRPKPSVAAVNHRCVSSILAAVTDSELRYSPRIQSLFASFASCSKVRTKIPTQKPWTTHPPWPSKTDNDGVFFRGQATKQQHLLTSAVHIQYTYAGLVKPNAAVAGLNPP